MCIHYITSMRLAAIDSKVGLVTPLVHTLTAIACKQRKSSESRICMSLLHHQLSGESNI